MAKSDKRNKLFEGSFHYQRRHYPHRTFELCISDEEEVWSEEWTCFLLDGPFSLTSIGKGTKNLPEVQTGLQAFSVSQIQRTLFITTPGFLLYFLWGLLHAWDLRRQTFDLYRAFQWPCCISLSSHCVFSGGKGVSPHPSQSYLMFGLECPIYTQKPVHV